MAFAGTHKRHPKPKPSPSVSVVAGTSPATPGQSTPAAGGGCPLPSYPDASCTGVPSGTNLTVVDGDLEIDTPNTVIDGKEIRGCVTVKAPGVVIRRSKVLCPDGEAVSSPDGKYLGTGLLIEDSQIQCGDKDGSTAVGDTNFVARRLDISWCENGFDVDQQVLIEDNFVHHLHNSEISHTDGIQLANHYLIENGTYVNGPDGKNVEVKGALDVTVKHNTLYAANPQLPADLFNGNSAIISNPGGDTHVLIEANLLAGGGYTLFCEQGSTGVDYRVIDNHFSTVFNPKVGAFGPATDCSDEIASGNVYHETGRPVPLD
jgi:hypothetical protein